MIKTEANVILNVEKNIPIEIIHSAANWLDIILNNLPFLITVLIVLVTGFVTYRSNRSSIENQNVNEQENKISEFRHHWLQEVRDTASKLVQRIYDIQHYYKLNKKLGIQGDKVNNLGLDSKHMENMIEELIISNKSLYSQISEFHKIEAKFRLLFKADDAKNLQVFTHINDVSKKIKSLDIESIENESASLIVSELQIILKKEWEVTKDRTWHKNS